MNQGLRKRNLWCFLLLISAIAMPRPALAYEKIVHLVLTAWLAESAGFSYTEALEIAKYDQATDDDPSTTPLPTLTSIGVQRRADYHFVDGRRLQVLEKDAHNCSGPNSVPPDYQRIGRFLHALEDQHSHRGYGPRNGHIFAGKGPDKPWNNPGAFRQMAERKFNALVEVRAECTSAARSHSAAPDFSEAAQRLASWANEEYRAGVRGDEDSPSRFNALLGELYGSDYEERVGGAYRTWLETQQRNDWRTQ